MSPVLEIAGETLREREREQDALSAPTTFPVACSSPGQPSRSKEVQRLAPPARTEVLQSVLSKEYAFRSLGCLHCRQGLERPPNYI